MDLVGRTEPGKSAQEKYDQLTGKREARVLARFPRMGKYLLALFSPPQSTKAWATGAIGEKKIGNFLNELAAKNDYAVLHDLAIPNSKANIDHILITNFGVFVIDSKNYQGLIETREKGSLFSGYESELYVGNRRRMNLISGMLKQISVVEKALPNFVPVRGILAFLHGEFPLFFKPTEIQGVFINSKGIKSILENFPRNQEIDVAITVKKLDKTFKPK